MIKKTILIVCLITGLTSCIPAVFVAGAAAGGAVIYDRRAIGTMLQDREIANRAQATLNDTPALRGAHIVVTSFNHIVLMVGQTPKPAQRSLAEELVSKVPSIKRIYNRITVAAPSSTLVRTNDAWITSKVKTMMLTKPGLKSGQIKVLTENSVVYLMGVVTRKQATLAVDVARRVSGVQEVVKVFEYE